MIVIYATATHRHFEVVGFQKNPTSNKVEMTVLVGRATVEASKLVPQVIARAVPLSVNPKMSESKEPGVPERFVVMEVIAAAKPVMFTTS